MDDFLRAAFGFATILLIPFLGLLALVKRRALPFLGVALVLWSLVGGVALIQGWHGSMGRDEWLRTWLTGAYLGLVFLGVAWLRTRPRVSRWVKLTMTLVTVGAFARALVRFLTEYV
jgi:hypothetical protein